MPPADIALASGEMRLFHLIYGYAKTKKTWWALKCAELGFNVILLDGDDGAQIVQQLSPAARKRVLVTDLTMQPTRTIFAPFIASLLRPDNFFFWDEQAKATTYTKTPGHSVIRFEAKKLTMNDVVIVDGWKALAESSLFQYAFENKLDLSDASKTEWDGYGWQGNFLNWVLARLHSLPCHVIVIGHATVYEKWDRRDKKNPKLLEQRTQPISASGPHAKKLASQFSDVLFFECLGPTTFKINTGGDKDRDGGSRFFEPRIYDWEDLGPIKFFEQVKVKSTGAKCEGAVWFGPDAELPTAPPSPVLTGGTKPSASGGSAVIEPQAAGGGGLSKLLALQGRKT